MYNLSDISAKFFSDKLITFKGSLNSTTIVFAPELTGVSKSNRYFNSGVHPVINIENIEAFLPVLSGYVITAYSAGTTYGNYNSTFSLSDIVSSGGKYYISIASGNLNHAVNVSTYWTETTLLSLILKDKIRSSIEVVMSNLIQPNFIEDNVSMYRISDNADDLIENTGKLVGLRINPISSDHLLFIINQIGLHFEGIETITFYLYNQNSLVSSFDLTSKAGLMEWKDLTASVEITANTGPWFLFYDQDELTGRAIGNNTIFTNGMFKYANVTPIAFDAVSDLADIESSHLVYDKNYGLNLNFTISYSLTNFIKNHLVQFAECIQKQFEYDIISMMCYNPDAQICARERNLNTENLMFELKSYEGDTVIKRLASAYKQMKATLTRLGYRDQAFSVNEDDNYSIGSI
ncbi:MAG TPA: hypothetical protein VIK55_06655 [Paludibacter sp.]